jgi:hypothetical protein
MSADNNRSAMGFCPKHIPRQSVRLAAQEIAPTLPSPSGDDMIPPTKK